MYIERTRFGKLIEAELPRPLAVWLSHALPRTWIVKSVRLTSPRSERLHDIYSTKKEKGQDD